jgi:hypothetical protein
MNQNSINNLNHVKKIMSIEFNTIMKDKDKDRAYHDYYVDLISVIDTLREMIDIASRPDEYIKIKKMSNPDKELK